MPTSFSPSSLEESAPFTFFFLLGRTSTVRQGKSFSRKCPVQFSSAAIHSIWASPIGIQQWPMVAAAIKIRATGGTTQERPFSAAGNGDQLICVCVCHQRTSQKMADNSALASIDLFGGQTFYNHHYAGRLTSGLLLALIVGRQINSMAHFGSERLVCIIFSALLPVVEHKMGQNSAALKSVLPFSRPSSTHA
jgi:hypothetical protein